MTQLNYEIAILIARSFLGVLFLMQGYDKVFRIGMNSVSRTFQEELRTNRFPYFFIKLCAGYTSYVELLGGLFLILGFLQHLTLYALGLDLLMVAVAMSLIEPLWKMDFVFPRLALLLLLLLLPEGSSFSLDYLLGLEPGVVNP